MENFADPDDIYVPGRAAVNHSKLAGAFIIDIKENNLTDHNKFPGISKEEHEYFF